MGISPRNILFDVTTVWSNLSQIDYTSFHYDPSVNTTLVTDYNYNQLEFQHDKPFVILNTSLATVELVGNLHYIDM